MALMKMEQPGVLVPSPTLHMLEEGPLIVEYTVTPIAPSLWMAHAEVLRGVPDDGRYHPHPRFSGAGATSCEAMKALMRELEMYLDDPMWEDLPCR